MAALVACALVFAAAPQAHAQPGGAPGTSADAAAEAQVHAALRGESAPIAATKESEAVPAGTITVRVEDENGVVVSGAAVEIGVLAQAGKRDKKTGMTDAAGNAVFAGLPTGSAQAYRVNVPFGGATYSSNPFQLPPSRGFEVTIRRLPVSNDERFLLQFLMRVYLELKDGRVQVVEQSQFTNLGKATYVFPKEGVEIVLPEERVAFQTQPTMGDQRIVESERGFRLFGSIPPGRVNLLWAFDLPLAGTEVAFKQAVPFRTYRFSIEADAPLGAKLDVAGMPAAISHEENGKRFFVVQQQVSPQDPQVKELSVRLSNLPGPGPARWIALALAVVFLAVGLVLVSRAPREAPRLAPEVLRARRDALLEEVASLEAEFASGDVGPKFHAERRREITEELALLLKAESAQPGAH
jgi:hypothetical protein